MLASSSTIRMGPVKDMECSSTDIFYREYTIGRDHYYNAVMEPELEQRQNTPVQGPIRLLVSSCLLGEKVRYDGGHKRDPFLSETLGRFVEFIPVCPEVECGFPTPREPMRLWGTPDTPQIIGAVSGTNFTELIHAWCRKKVHNLKQFDPNGFICRKESPSCGMDRIKMYGIYDTPARVGMGIFTKMFMEHFPLVPVEEDGRLQDPSLREMFLERVFTLRRFRESFRNGKSNSALLKFHTNHRLLILSHGRAQSKEMGNLISQAKNLSIDELYGRYQRLLLEALAQRATPAKCADVMTHTMGHLRMHLTQEEKQELAEMIDRYRNRILPMVVPATMFRHYIRKHDIAYLERQVFLNPPHPAELMLRNHV
ncbi:MAG: DUF523 and DUF1722 domain-containing protein [Syntrophorhabdaceae bacterium]|nr:DUF523 and DUF1722 domain-containing protein [Syntrophorhabdaceae bacterium]